MTPARLLTPTEYADRRRAERRRQAGALGIALAASVLIHVVLFRTVSFEVPVQRQSAPTPPRIVDVAPVMRAYDLVTVDIDVPPIEVQVLERQVLRQTDRPALDLPAAEITGVRPPTERIPSSVRERLQYRMGSAPDVWTPPRAAEPGELEPLERVERRVASSIQQYNDSVAGALAAEEKALDWTVRDEDGKRWGVSPGKIHMGDVTVPMPFAFTPAPGRREEIAGRVRNWEEIQQQAAREEGRAILDDRIRAIRERMDRERRARMQQDTLPRG